MSSSMTHDQTSSSVMESSPKVVDKNPSKVLGSLSCSSCFVSLGLCQLNQWALDFEGNLARILESIRQVKAKGGYFRLGPELEVTGYSCDDHYYESDTTQHAWQSIRKILESGCSHNCLLDIGMPVEHKSIRYNCRVYILNDEILLIRPKCVMANDGNYRESRWFGAFSIDSPLEEFTLPKSVQKLAKSARVPFGLAAIECNDCSLAAESCEELFAPSSPHLQMCLDGVEIFANGSGSYHEIGKVHKRMNLINAPMRKMGGVYMYCNQKGNDGGRLYYDGASFIACNGEVISMVEPFRLDSVEVIVQRVNLSHVRSLRASMPSFHAQGVVRARRTPRVRANIWLSGVSDSSIRVMMGPRSTVAMGWPSVEAEIGLGPACWLWDYLRRSGSGGFIVALSGGADSAAVSVIVYQMCILVMGHISNGDPSEEVIEALEKVLNMDRKNKLWPVNAKDLCNLILHTVYLGTANSSPESKRRASTLAQDINSYHLEMDMDSLFQVNKSLVEQTTGTQLQFLSSAIGSSKTQQTTDLALQNMQARSRMVMTYSLGSVLPLRRAKERGFDTGGFLIVLSTGNLDETLRGYFTKYDCSSGDLNPIGSMKKADLASYLRYAATKLQISSLHEILSAPPSAELRPPVDGVLQEDEADMGLTYEQLGFMGSIRKQGRAGPVEMFETLVQIWRDTQFQELSRVPSTDNTVFSPTRQASKTAATMGFAKDWYSGSQSFLHDPEMTIQKIADMVKLFYVKYAANRHKCTTLTPSYHADSASVDDNRFDWRPFLYPPFTRQFTQIDALVEFACENDSGTEDNLSQLPEVVYRQ